MIFMFLIFYFKKCPNHKRTVEFLDIKHTHVASTWMGEKKKKKEQSQTLPSDALKTATLTASNAVVLPAFDLYLTGIVGWVLLGASESCPPCCAQGSDGWSRHSRAFLPWGHHRPLIYPAVRWSILVLSSYLTYETPHLLRSRPCQPRPPAFLPPHPLAFPWMKALK